MTPNRDPHDSLLRAYLTRWLSRSHLPQILCFSLQSMGRSPRRTLQSRSGAVQFATTGPRPQVTTEAETEIGDQIGIAVGKKQTIFDTKNFSAKPAERTLSPPGRTNSLLQLRFKHDSNLIRHAELRVLEINGQIGREDFEAVKKGSDIMLLYVFWGGRLGFNIDKASLHERHQVEISTSSILFNAKATQGRKVEFLLQDLTDEPLQGLAK